MTDQPNAPLVLTLVANALLLLEGRVDDTAGIVCDRGGCGEVAYCSEAGVCLAADDDDAVTS